MMIEEAGMINMINKTIELKKLEDWKFNKVRSEVYSQRENLLKRHRKIKTLEEKADIVKERELDSIEKKKFTVNEFGFEKVYNFDELFEKLSKPKKNEEYSYTKSDLRGIINNTPKLNLSFMESNESSGSNFLLTGVKTKRRQSN